MQPRINRIRRWLNLNCGPLLLEATALITEYNRCPERIYFMCKYHMNFAEKEHRPFSFRSCSFICSNEWSFTTLKCSESATHWGLILDTFLGTHEILHFCTKTHLKFSQGKLRKVHYALQCLCRIKCDKLISLDWANIFGEEEEEAEEKRKIINDDDEWWWQFTRMM